MKSIVVPVNFGVNSNNAARYAAELALAAGADIHLVYSFQIPVSMSEAPMPESVFEELQGGALDLLKDLADQLAKQTEGKVKITTDLKIGTVEGSIEEFCAEVQPSLVVMGATGAGIENVLIGSATRRAVGHLPYPILVVPEDVHFHPIRKIVMACDRDDLDMDIPQVIPMLRDLGGLAQAQLTVMHVLGGEESAAEFLQAYYRWKDQLKGLTMELQLIRGKGVEEGLSEFLAKCEADLVLVFPKKHGWLEFHRSQAKRLVMHCAVPVMSVHE